MQYGVEERMIRRVGVVVEVKYFKCREKGHKCKECPLWVRKEKVVHVARPQKVQQEEKPARPIKEKAQEKKRRLKRAEEREVAHVAKPQEAQQGGWRRSLVAKLRKRVKEHCNKGVLEEAHLLELGWCTKEVIVTYVQCKRCREKECYVEENRRQGLIKNRQRWYGCQKKEEKKVVHPTEEKVQQSGAQPRESESTAKEGGSQREIRRTFKMLREVWMSIGVEKLDTHEGVTVKALLDSGATRMFMDKRIMARYGFKLQKLERPIMVRNCHKLHLAISPSIL